MDISALQNSSYFKLISNRKKQEANRPKPISKELHDKRTKQWTTFYRRNINIYIEDRLKIKLKLMQHIMLYLMGISQVFVAICSRGLTKTFSCGIFSVAICMLYPWSEVVITSSTIDQANKIVEDKIQKELIGKLSPVLKYLYEVGMITITKPKDTYIVKFWNGSTIKCLPALDSSRGERATLIIAEEARLISKKIWDSVFTKMLRPRRAEFLDNNDEFSNDPRLLENGREIYITSAYFKTEWFWRKFKTAVNGCLNNDVVKYNFYGGDIFVAIYHGLKTTTDLIKSRKDSGELEFRMEDLNEMVGESENAYFSLEMFRRNQILKKAFRPPTIAEFNNQTKTMNRKKRDNEKRLLSVDLSFTNNKTSDNSVIECISNHLNIDRSYRNLEYIEVYKGGNTDFMVRRIKELFWDYEADYLVLDLRSGGETIFELLTTPQDNPYRSDSDWNKHGFALSTDDGLQIISNQKIDELRGRTVDPQGVPCIIPIMGNTELNSNMWKSLWKAINSGSIRFLIDELEVENQITEENFMLMTSEEKRNFKLPYVQTGLLIHEGINLSQNWNNGVLKLTEPRLGFKDRMTTLQYANYICDRIENKYAKSLQESEFNYGEWERALLG